MAHGREDWREHDEAAAAAKQQQTAHREGCAREHCGQCSGSCKDCHLHHGSKRYAIANVMRERIAVGEVLVVKGHLMGTDLINMEDIILHEVLQDDRIVVGICDCDGVVSGDVTGNIQRDGTYALHVAAVTRGSFLTIDYNYRYELPECQSDHVPNDLTAKVLEESEEMSAIIERLEQRIVVLEAERDYWEKKYRTS